MDNDMWDWPCYNCGSDGKDTACFACWPFVIKNLQADIKALEFLLRRERPVGLQAAQMVTLAKVKELENRLSRYEPSSGESDGDLID